MKRAIIQSMLGFAFISYAAAFMKILNPVLREGHDVAYMLTGLCTCTTDVAPVLKTLKNAANETMRSDVPLTRRDDGTWSIQMDAAAPGLYRLHIVHGTSSSTVLHATVTTEVDIASVDVLGMPLTPGVKMDTIPVLSSTDVFSIDISLQTTRTKAPVMAHQAFLRFTRDGVDATFVLDKHPTLMKMSRRIHVGAASQRFSFLSGIYTIQLILGDIMFEV